MPDRMTQTGAGVSLTPSPVESVDKFDSRPPSPVSAWTAACHFGKPGPEGAREEGAEEDGEHEEGPELPARQQVPGADEAQEKDRDLPTVAHIYIFCL